MWNTELFTRMNPDQFKMLVEGAIITSGEHGEWDVLLDLLRMLICTDEWQVTTVDITTIVESKLDADMVFLRSKLRTEIHTLLWQDEPVMAAADVRLHDKTNNSLREQANRVGDRLSQIIQQVINDSDLPVANITGKMCEIGYTADGQALNVSETFNVISKQEREETVDLFLAEMDATLGATPPCPWGPPKGGERDGTH